MRRELRDFYFWLNIIRTCRSQMVSISELVAGMGEKNFRTGFWCENWKERILRKMWA
jgi:hypothetical protein